MANKIEPRRVALRYAPPGIIIEYTHSSRQLFHHEIDLQDALQGGASLDVNAIVAELITAHSHVLGERKVSSRQLARLVQRLADQTASHISGTTSVSTSRDRAGLTAALPQADYNRVSETQLKQVKLKMDLVFEQNIVRPGQADYEYDKQVVFTPAQEASDWDDD